MANKNNTRKNKKNNNNAKLMKELYPHLELSFSDAQLLC